MEDTALEELQAKARRQQAAYSTDEPKTARSIFAMTLERIERGDHSPYRLRVTDPQKRAAMQDALIRDRGIRYASCSLESYEVSCNEQRQAVSQLREFCESMPERLIESNGGGVVFSGPPGTGKDHLLMALMTSAILDWGLSVKWLDGLRMYEGIKSAIANNTTSEKLNALIRPQVLAISDPVPPRDELSAYEMACIRQVVEGRYSRGLTTWVTTNIRSGEEAKRRLTPAILGRLLDRALELKCEWAGYRRPLMTGTSKASGGS